ncbi:MAG: M50 family metallopeptidase [Candidatus Hodarchaeales archaeon]
MTDNDDWKKVLEKDFTRKSFLDRFNLSINEISELGIGWLISSVIILYITGTFNILINEGRIPDSLIMYLLVLGVSFFTHELFHKFTAIHFGAKAYFRLSKEGLFITLLSVLVGMPILAVGAVFWWGEATTSPGIRGRVSAAGPISNLILTGIFLIVQGLGLSMLSNVSTIQLGLILFFIGSTGVWLNVFLGFFNLLPIGVLDGAKVLAWDPKIWGSLIGSFIIIGIFGANLL